MVHYENNEPTVSTTSINYITPAALPQAPVFKPVSILNPVAQFTGADPTKISALPPLGTRCINSNQHLED